MDLLSFWDNQPSESNREQGITSKRDRSANSNNERLASRKKAFPFWDGFQAKKNRQFFSHTVFKFIFTTVIFYISYDQSQARIILFGWIWLLLLVSGFSTHFKFLWFAFSWLMETFSMWLVHILKREEQQTHLYACKHARKARDDIISQNNDRIWHHLLALISEWQKKPTGF